jgi:glycosyltransferase involved in cell wall biosynthesis
MSRARAVFVPTIYIEPFGNVAVEAQGCGTPVICTDWGAMTETVVHGVTGFRCRTFQEFIDATLLVQALDPRAIRDHARDNYGLEAIAEKYDRHFKRLLTLWDDGWYHLEGAT